MPYSLIVARVKPRDHPDVARIFAESDAGELPAKLRVTGRWLFGFHGLYFHLVEAEPGLRERIAAHRDDPLYTRITDQLASHVTAYDPATWRGPADAMATEFYSWEAGR